MISTFKYFCTISLNAVMQMYERKKEAHMPNHEIHSLMLQIFGACSYGIYIKDEYDFRWNGWLLEGVSSEYSEDMPLTTEWRTWEYSFEFLSNCLIHVVVHTRKELTLLQSERLERIIREELLKQQIDKERLRNQNWLSGLRELTYSLELNDLLLKIMESALEVIPSLSSGLFMMVDPGSDKMIPRAKVGFQDSVYQYQGELNEGITGKVYEEGIGRIYSSPDEAMKDMDNVSQENTDIIVSALPDGSLAKGMIAVPVTMNTHKIGVMLVYQFEHNKRLAPHDLHIMQGFADQAAIAISNATMYAELLQANQYLISRNEIHDQFTKLSIEQVNLGQIIETVGGMLHLPTYYVDMARNDWYPASPPSTMIREANIYSHVSHSLEPTTLTSHEESIDFYVYPIVNGSLVFGCFVIRLDHELRQLDHVILEQGASIVMLEMMKTYSITEMSYRKNHDFFSELVQYSDPLQLETRYSHFQLPIHQSLFVVQIQLHSEESDAKTTEIRIRKLIGLIEKELTPQEHLLFSTLNKLTILAAAATTQMRRSIISKLESAVHTWSAAASPSISIGIGELYQGLSHVSKSNDEANRSLSFLLKRNKSGIMLYGDFGINKLFLNQEPAEIENYIQEILVPLRQQKSGELELTLKTYIAMNRSVQETAVKLHIHTNTLYLRLRKIEEILKLDLNDSEGWMRVYLACHLSEVY